MLGSMVGHWWHHGCWSPWHHRGPQEVLFRNAQLCRSLPFEARQALAEFLVAQQAALWADEQLDQKETPKKDGAAAGAGWTQGPGRQTRVISLGSNRWSRPVM